MALPKKSKFDSHSMVRLWLCSGQFSTVAVSQNACCVRIQATQLMSTQAPATESSAIKPALACLARVLLLRSLLEPRSQVQCLPVSIENMEE